MKPRPTARAALHNCVKRLRDSLGLALRARISTEPSGYMITLRDGELDVACFEAKLHEARAAAKAASWDAAAGHARAALALWRGQPLADLTSEVLAVREAGRLTELRLQAADRYPRGDTISQIAWDLRVTEGLARRWRRAWRDHGQEDVMIGVFG